MVEVRVRIEMPEPVSLSRFDPTPEPYLLLIRDTVDDDGVIVATRKWRLYDDAILDDETMEPMGAR